MRIIAGKYKGKKLALPKTEKTRPTADMVKQALFTKLFDAVVDCHFLDLFAGSGSIGIEALSRGAKEVVFVDKEYDAIALIKKNLEMLEGNYTIHKNDFKVFLNSTDKKFDLIFIDPPYESGFYAEALKLIFEKKVLCENGIIICEHEKTNPLQQDYFEVFDIKTYGIKMLTYLKNK